MRNLSLITIVLASSAGCVESELDLGVDDQALVHDNGVRLNGVRLNGVRLNGVRLNGVRLNGVRLNGVRLNGVRLNGSELTASTHDGTLTGAELVGSRWSGALSDGSSLALRIDEVSTGTGSNADVTIYGFSYQTPEGWSDLCDGAGALAVAGTWNYEQGTPEGGSYDPDASQFTLACRGFAIAKCVEFGYKPWLDRSAYLGTCTRTLRADYCGDGTPYTVNGTTIDLYDADGIQADETDWPLEARWDEHGATCIGEDTATRFYQVAGVTPTCLDALPRCGSSAPTGLITTELPPVE